MIYISVDNDHHGDLALLLIKKLGLATADVTFISHVSRRNTIIPASDYPHIVIEGHPLSNGSGYKRLVSYIRSIKSQHKLNATFNFSPRDTLLIITEYQLNNALLARKMKRAGGQVYLFDEGISFYLNNSQFHEAHTKLLDKAYLMLYNFAFWLLSIPAYSRKGFEGRMYVCIDDVLIDRIYSRMRLPINRPKNIDGYKNFLVSESATQEKNEKISIFFASNLSCFGLKDQELALVSEVLKHMASVFERVYIKIHPADVAEENDIFRFYLGFIGLYENISLIAPEMTVNAALEYLKPSLVVGTMGASMFDAFFFGCQPIFLFQLLPSVPEFRICRYILDGMGYRYAASIADIGPQYHCAVDVSTLLYADNCFSEWQLTELYDA